MADGGNGHGDHDPDDLGHCLGAVDLDARDSEEQCAHGLSPCQSPQSCPQAGWAGPAKCRFVLR